MSGTRFESEQQAAAFSGLVRDERATGVHVFDLPHRAVGVTLWREDSDVPVCTAIITAGGHIRTELSIAA